MDVDDDIDQVQDDASKLICSDNKNQQNHNQIQISDNVQHISSENSIGLFGSNFYQKAQENNEFGSNIQPINSLFPDSQSLNEKHGGLFGKSEKEDVLAKGQSFSTQRESDFYEAEEIMDNEKTPSHKIYQISGGNGLQISMQKNISKESGQNMMLPERNISFNKNSNEL